MKIFNKKSDEEKVEEEIISMVNEGNEQGLIEDSEAHTTLMGRTEMVLRIFYIKRTNCRETVLTVLRQMSVIGQILREIRE